MARFLFPKRLPSFLNFAGLIILSCLVAATKVNAAPHDGDDHVHGPKKITAAALAAPTAMPDRIVLNFCGPPTTMQAVTWRTSTEVVTGIAEIAVAGNGPDFASAATKVIATSDALKSDLNTSHYHSVRFKDLKPGTKYAYRVGDGVNWSEWFHFTTAQVVPEPFSFVYFGDAQNGIRSFWSRVVREAYSDAPKAKFFLHAGDLVNTAESDADWGEWFGAGSWLNASIPNVATPGNHEQHKTEEGSRRLSHHWRVQFTQPENGIEGLEECCFWFEYQDMLLVSLDSNRKLEEQAKWLDTLLTANKKPWVVLTFHHPIFSTAKDRDNAQLRSLWKPILDKHKVDLVLQGHDHSYGRTGLDTPVAEVQTVGNVPTGANVVDRFTGTVYVVSVSGQKMYNVDPKPFMVRMGEDTQLYQIISIDGNRLRYEAKTATGLLYDGFTLEKTPGELNRLLESEIAMPERRRPAALPK